MTAPVVVGAGRWLVREGKPIAEAVEVRALVPELSASAERRGSPSLVVVTFDVLDHPAGATMRKLFYISEDGRGDAHGWHRLAPVVILGAPGAGAAAPRHRSRAPQATTGHDRKSRALAAAIERFGGLGRSRIVMPRALPVGVAPDESAAPIAHRLAVPVTSSLDRRPRTAPPPDGDSDASLIEAIRRGDHHAFEVLYDRHSGWVLALAMRFLGDRDDALDVLSETFEYLAGRVGTLTLTTSLRGFLYPAVRHRAIDKVRSRQRHVDVEDLVLVETSGSPDWMKPDLRRALAALPGAQRETVLMRFGDGFSLKEIAEALAVPEGTVKSRLHHALLSLRRFLGP